MKVSERTREIEKHEKELLGALGALRAQGAHVYVEDGDTRIPVTGLVVEWPAPKISVWVVVRVEYASREVEGVFFTESSAESFLKSEGRRGDDTVGFYIEEWEAE